MTNREKKVYLEQYRRMGQRIDRMTESLERMYAMAMKLTQTLSDMPKSGVVDDRMAKAIELVIELNDQINREIDAYVDKRQEIMRAICTVNDPVLQTLLEYRYLDGKTWEEIAEKMSYSERHVRRLHNKAIEAMKDVLECPVHDEL